MVVGIVSGDSPRGTLIERFAWLTEGWDTSCGAHMGQHRQCDEGGRVRGGRSHGRLCVLAAASTALSLITGCAGGDAPHRTSSSMSAGNQYAVAQTRTCA